MPGRGNESGKTVPVSAVPAGAGRGASAVDSLQGSGERILFLDDEEPIVLLARRMLKHLGYQVEAFTGAADALEQFRSRAAEFDLVVTDLSMPGASGMDFAREVLAIRPELPVLLTTGFIEPGDLDRARGIGIREVIQKPTTLEEMGQAFRRQLAPR